jgi:hypothetical protein
MAELTTVAKSLITDLKVLVYEEENWTLVNEEDGIKVFKKESANAAL